MTRALVVYEAQETLGFGAEVAARLADKAFPWLDAPVRRVAYPDRPVPFSNARDAGHASNSNSRLTLPL